MARSQNPELQRLLAALNGYSAPEPTVPNQTVRSVESAPKGNANESAREFNAAAGGSIPGLGFLPPEAELAHREATPTSSLRVTFKPTSALLGPAPADPRSRSTTPSIPDASTITTWPAALKHVTKFLMTSEKASTRIKHLISEQHKHEQQWWAGREALVAQQDARSGKSQQVSALLKQLGGKDMRTVQPDLKANQAELENYDKKVYAGLVAMTADFDRQLRVLGVPFYAIKHELVILKEGREKAHAMKGRVDKGELRELQRRMLQTLEDLFAD